MNKQEELKALKERKKELLEDLSSLRDEKENAEREADYWAGQVEKLESSLDFAEEALKEILKKIENLEKK